MVRCGAASEEEVAALAAAFARARIAGGAAAPPTGLLQNLRSWFENDEYATDTMRRPRLSPRPRRSARRSAGVELSTFAQRAASPVRFALEALSPAPVRGENPLSRWV